MFSGFGCKFPCLPFTEQHQVTGFENKPDILLGQVGPFNILAGHFTIVFCILLTQFFKDLIPIGNRFSQVLFCCVPIDAINRLEDLVVYGQGSRSLEG